MSTPPRDRGDRLRLIDDVSWYGGTVDVPAGDSGTLRGSSFWSSPRSIWICVAAAVGLPHEVKARGDLV